jgi:hypothetical protein
MLLVVVLVVVVLLVLLVQIYLEENQSTIKTSG